MKILFLKISTIIASLIGFFAMGRKSGINKINNKINKQVLEDVKETQKIKNRINKLTVDEQYDRL
jgi:hypothetical protein